MSVLFRLQVEVAASSDTCLLCHGGICGHRQCLSFDVALCAAFGLLLVQSSDQF